MTTYRNHLLAAAARWKLGESNAAHVLGLLPESRCEETRAAAQRMGETAGARIAARMEREQRRVTQWGRMRYGASIWDRLDPRVQQHLVREHGRNH